MHIPHTLFYRFLFLNLVIVNNCRSVNVVYSIVIDCREVIYLQSNYEYYYNASLLYISVT